LPLAIFPGVPAGAGILGCGIKLKRIHSDSTIISGSNKYSHDYWKQKSTEDIIESLRPGSSDALKIKPDGRIFDENTRIKILEERGVNVESLPREILK